MESSSDRDAPSIMQLPLEALQLMVVVFLRGAGDDALAAATHLKLVHPHLHAAAEAALPWRQLVAETFYANVTVSASHANAAGELRPEQLHALRAAHFRSLPDPPGERNAYKLLFAILRAIQKGQERPKPLFSWPMLPAPLPEAPGEQDVQQPGPQQQQAQLQEAQQQQQQQRPPAPDPVHAWYGAQHRCRYYSAELVRALSAGDVPSAHAWLAHLRVLRSHERAERQHRAHCAPRDMSQPELQPSDRAALREAARAAQGPLPLLADPPAPQTLRRCELQLSHLQEQYTEITALGVLLGPESYTRMLSVVELELRLLQSLLGAWLAYLRPLPATSTFACPGLDATGLWLQSCDRAARSCGMLQELLDLPAPRALAAEPQLRARRVAASMQLGVIIWQLEEARDVGHALQPMDKTLCKLNGMRQVLVRKSEHPAVAVAARELAMSAWFRPRQSGGGGDASSSGGADSSGSSSSRTHGNNSSQMQCAESACKEARQLARCMHSMCMQLERLWAQLPFGEAQRRMQDMIEHYAQFAQATMHVYSSPHTTA